MHDDRACYAAALRTACQWVGRNPALARTVRRGGPEATPLRAAFARTPGARCYLRRVRARLVPGGDGERVDALVGLLDEAQDYLQLGQFRGIEAAWDKLRQAGTLGTLPRTDRAVLQAVFMLALRTGPQVIAARGYVQTLLAAEFGIEVSGQTVANAYQRLASRHLLEVLPGKRGRSRDASTRIDLRCIVTGHSAQPSNQAKTDLTMRPSTITALQAYRVAAYASLWRSRPRCMPLRARSGLLQRPTSCRQGALGLVQDQPLQSLPVSLGAGPMQEWTLQRPLPVREWAGLL